MKTAKNKPKESPRGGALSLLSRRRNRIRNHQLGENWTAAEGARFPLGASWIESEQAWNFSLYSDNATDVVLLIYRQHDCEKPLLVTYKDEIG